MSWKGHSYFFSTQSGLCSYDSIYSKGACWTLLILYAIGSTNILDAYVIFCCVKEIKNQLKKQNNQLDSKLISTEKGKKSLKLENYIHRQVLNKFENSIKEEN
jgi:hypothetical protein